MKELEANGVTEHGQLGRIVNSFISGLEYTKENIELELIAVLSMIEVGRSSVGVATTAFAKVASDGGSQLADDYSRCSL